MHVRIERIIRRLEETHPDAVNPDIPSKKDPFLVLISCILSQRTKDEVTATASERLFKLAKRPEEMLKLEREVIERAIYPVGFYRKKASQIKEISRELLERYKSEVPDEIGELLKIKGVGRKTANIVLTHGFGKPGIAVDTHVHRISNRIGITSTRNPIETETALRDLLPQKYWINLNTLLVRHGQRICRPISPKCSICTIREYCERVGVKEWR
ncbi:MAG: endonuclease III domain-containing protein [Methanosarcinales archaeon]